MNNPRGGEKYVGIMWLRRRLRIRRWLWRRFNFCFNRRIVHSVDYRTVHYLIYQTSFMGGY
jgi:hypothetical protein